MLRRSAGALAGAGAPNHAVGKGTQPGDGPVCHFFASLRSRELEGEARWPVAAWCLCHGAGDALRLAAGALAVLYRSAPWRRCGGVRRLAPFPTFAPFPPLFERAPCP